ncbi:MAG: GntR family transcriptional regulator [Kofleriaceae bacterium]|nr:GntR family transcriptional regulator [Kofleriaceae bacterium]MCL4229013.1 GntR family transcriptional regulator [Myxococcales bacterium]
MPPSPASTALAPIPAREPAHQACEHALRRAVLTGELAPGARLPPERELAATLGVSRLTLRAALATLTAQGVLAVRHGSGYVVQDVRRTGGPDLLPGLADLAQRQGELPAIAAELLRVRRHLARAVLEHLVEHPPRAADVRAFARAVDALAAAVTTTPADVDALAAADLGVVAALLDATRSPVLRLSLNPVIAVVASAAPLRAAMFRAPADNVAGWRALGAWLAAPAAGAIDPVIAILAARDRSTVELLRRQPAPRARRSP